ncbi:hypothetical protein HUB94_17160 [Paenibacillus cellulosilyticus]|nr:hypothetical protein HUB94_17160 [Paenibacillus cellulosilyticus]
MVNGWIYIQQQLQQHREIIQYHAQYIDYEARFRELSGEAAYELALVSRDQLSAYLIAYNIEREPDNEATRIFASDDNYQRYGAQYPSSKYANNIMLLMHHIVFNQTILEQLEALRAYPDYVNQIEAQAQNMLKYSIFNDPHSFTYRNIMKTPQDFERVKGVNLQLSLDYGVVTATHYRLTDIMLLTILILLGLFIFNTEREQGQLLLFRTMKYGHARLIIAKLLMLTGSALVIAMIFYGSILLVANQLYGLGDGSRYIQAMDAFKFANLPLTVYEYIVAFLVGKMVVSVVLALLIALLIILFQHPGKSLLALALVLAASYLGYTFIHPASYWNLFKYINLVAFFDIAHLLTNYVNLNLFGYPFTNLWVSVVVIGLLMVVLLVGSGIALDRSFGKQRIGGFQWWYRSQQLIIRVLTPLHQSSSIWWHESLKQWGTAKGWLIVLVALLIGWQDIHNAHLVMDNDQYYYNDYMKQVGGLLTTDKAAYIEKEMVRRNGALSDLQTLDVPMQGIDESNSDDTRLAQDDANQLTRSNNAFNKLYNQYQAVQANEQTRGITAYMVNQYAADYLFQNKNRDTINTMIVVFLLTLLLASSYTLDTRNQMLALLKTTRCGRRRLFLTTWLYGLAIITLLLGIIYTAQYVNAARLYPALDWQAPIQNLESYEQLSFHLTLRGLVVLTILGQWLGAAAMSAVMLLLSQVLKRLSLTLLAGIVLVCCPTFLTWLGYDVLTKYTLHYAQLGFRMFSTQSIAEIVGYFASLVLLLVVCVGLAWRYYLTGRAGLWGAGHLRARSMPDYAVKGAEVD